ncbi:MAG TPA: hypothetical protein VMV69_24170 [Pirellulales bacterium]|nr:hypothetical protein [Pirellulales bacterium]
MTHQPSSFSAGVDHLLRVLHPQNAPTGERAFPCGVHRREFRQRGDESVLAMFRRVVSAATAGDPTPFKVEENLAVFGVVNWVEANTLQFARIIAR